MGKNQRVLRSSVPTTRTTGMGYVLLKSVNLSRPFGWHGLLGLTRTQIERMNSLTADFTVYRIFDRIRFVQTGFGLYVQMLWTVWSWRGCLGNESSDISFAARWRQQKRLSSTVMCLIMFYTQWFCSEWLKRRRAGWGHSLVITPLFRKGLVPFMTP